MGYGTQETFKLASRLHCLLLWDWGIGHKNDCEIQAEKGNVGPWNIDLTNK